MTRVTVLGSGTSAPQAETPASGVLVETASTGILIDCGQGVIRGLLPIRDPRGLDAVFVGHLHADHYLDLVALRYLLPWADFSGRRLPVLLPPGGRQRMAELASAISERPGFFEDAFEIVEYDPAATVTVGDLSIEFIPGRHYIPAWGFAVRDRAGGLVVLSGDTGPNEALVAAARGADLFLVEATMLAAVEDDADRGHLTVDEALDIGERAGAGRTILVHYRSENRETVLAACLSRDRAVAGRPGLVLDVVAPGPIWTSGQAGDQIDGEIPVGIASSAARAR
jgi:ribonuclease BN (tRNA processing enzyme)